MIFTHTSKAKTTEAEELDKIRALRKSLAKKRKIADESHRKAMVTTGYVPVRSMVPLTRPEEFHFTTDDRLKGVASPAPKEVDFATNLRHYVSQPVRSYYI